MHSRFPNTLLLSEHNVRSLHLICFMSEEELKGYGVEDLGLLLAHYGLEQTHKWIEGKENHQITNRHLSMLNKLVRTLLKKAVKAQHYSWNATWKLGVGDKISPERLPQQHHPCKTDHHPSSTLTWTIWLHTYIQYTQRESEPWITSKWMHLMFPLAP